MQNSDKLNNQVFIKNNLDLKNDYILITAQDKNIQKDYIIQGQELIDIISNRIQKQVFESIKATNSTVLTQNGNSLWITYDDATLRQLIVKNSQQVEQIAEMFNNYDPTDMINGQIEIGLQDTTTKLDELTEKVTDFEQIIQTVEDIAQQIIDTNIVDSLAELRTAIQNLQQSLDTTNQEISNIKNDITILKTTVTTAVEDKIKLYYDDALDYIDEQIEFSQTKILNP